MRILIAGLIAGSVALGSAAPSQALTNEEKTALAAAALLGIAALSHHKNHYQEGYSPQGDNETAMFEAGYRDGLHNAQFDTGYGTRSYSEGYAAGHKERDNRLAHKRRDVNGVKVPAAAIAGCRDEVSSSFGVGMRDVHLINAGQEGSDNFYLEMASGHRHVICGTNSKGQVFNLRNGRL